MAALALPIFAQSPIPQTKLPPVTAAAEKAQAADKIAEKSAAIEKVAEKVETAQKVAEQAAVAEKAQKAAEKAALAENVAGKAETAQKIAEQAAVAEKAQKAAEKAALAEKVVGKAETAQKVAEQAAVAEKLSAVEKISTRVNTFEKSSIKAESASKAADRAGKAVGAVKTDLQLTGTALSIPNQRKDQIFAAPSGKDSGVENSVGKNTSSENLPPATGQVTTFKNDSNKNGASANAKNLENSNNLESLKSLGITERQALSLVGKLAAGEKEAESTVKLLIDAAATLSLAGAADPKVQKVLSEIVDRRLTDASSGGETDTLVGAVIIETLTGNKPNKNIARQGEVARALIHAQGELELAGLAETKEGEALLQQIVSEGLRGDNAKAATRGVIRPFVGAIEREQADSQSDKEPASSSPPRTTEGQPQLAEGTEPRTTGAESTAGTQPATGPENTANTQPTPSTPAPETPGTGEIAGPISLGSGNLTSTDPNLNGQPAELFEDPVTGAIFAVTADGTTVPISPGNVTEGGKPVDPRVVGEGGETTVSANRGEDGSGNQNSQNSNSETANNDQSNDGSNKNDDDNDNDDKNETADSTAATANNTETETESEAGDTNTADSSTPNPDEVGATTGMELAQLTGGRLGSQQATQQGRALDLLRSGGGAGGPSDNPESGGSGILNLSPGEIGILSRTMSKRGIVKTTGGAVDPSPVDKDGIAITDRDIKELTLRGNGGAKGPTEGSSSPPSPQDPKSPVRGPGIVAPPSTNSGVVSSSVISSGIISSNAANIQIKTDTIKNVQ